MIPEQTAPKTNLDMDFGVFICELSFVNCRQTFHIRKIDTDADEPEHRDAVNMVIASFVCFMHMPKKSATGAGIALPMHPQEHLTCA